ncbi:LamG domain-containing protein, partial [Candidatus Woesearchaeota archaeon]|nr:LamG domain-containing protein [Candidatus Woesearchaeota archaeon]
LDDISRSSVRLYRITDNGREPVSNITYYDENNNSLIDLIEWIVPSLSNQTYELIIEIIKAEHLDGNRSFVSDIYNETYQLDNIWSEPVQHNEYVRVTFERALDNTRDITIYARSSSSAAIEVYSEGSDALITAFEDISSEGWYKVYLTSLNSSHEVFDLKILNSDVEFDHIVDPKIGGAGNISFVPPTPANASTISTTYAEINASIKANLSEVKFNWNGTNYTAYNNSLVLMFNFGNISAIGENYNNSNGTIIVDLSRNGNNGTLFVGNDYSANYTSGRYGNAFYFDGIDDYINATVPEKKISWEYWAKNISGDGIWHYYANSSGTEYIDGEAGTFAKLYDSDGDDIYIGKISSSYYFNGSIDEIRIWNTTLPAAHIRQHYFSNLRKYDIDRWYLYVNQSNSSTTGLADGNYSYYAYAKDINGKSNKTETRIVEVYATPPSSKRFGITNNAGANVASIDNKGDMYLKGNITEQQPALSPTPNSFVLQNRSGDTIAYINSSGYLFIAGTLTERASMAGAGTKLEIRNSSDHLVAFFDNEGNLKLKKRLVQNYASP